MAVRKLVLLFADRTQILANSPNDATVIAWATCAKELTYNDEGKPRTLYALALDFIGDSGVPMPFQGRTCLVFEVLPDNAIKPIQCNQLALGNVCASEVIAMARKLYDWSRP